MQRPSCCGKPMTKSGRAQSGRQRYTCGGTTGCGRRTTNPEGNDKADQDQAGLDPEIAKANLERLRQAVKSGARRFVVTAAQNNTRVHKQFLRTLEIYSAHNNAELIVIPIHYKNISLYTASQQYKKWWAPELEPYLLDANLYLGGNVEVAADTKISATAASPLTGLQEVGGSRWQILGHSQLGMVPVAAPISLVPKRLYSTGAVTIRNYSRTKYGKKAEFHHSMSALVVEVARKKTAFVRQLGYGDGCVYDIAGGELRRYDQDGVRSGGRALALVPGDEHVKFHDPGVYRATYGAGGMTEVLRPQYLMRHDVLDAYAGSHHHNKDPLKQFEKHHNGGNNYREELDQVVEFINRTTPDDCVNVIVDSNHHDHLQTYLNNSHVNVDHANAVFIAVMQAEQRRAILEGRDYRPMRLYCEPLLEVPALWLNRLDPFLLKGVDYSQHGDAGINGARGSAASMARATFKAVIGHSHTAQIVKGVYQVGKSMGVAEYERGLSTHTQTHCVQYPNGKRSLLDIFNGRYRGDF